VEQIHSSIKERKAAMAVKKREDHEETKVWEETMPGPDGEQEQKVLTVDFLRKYITYCRQLQPVLSEKSQAKVSERYVDMRMRFQSGFADVANPNSEQKPRLAVTTRTLEALIRLATAHAKIKLRKEEVLEEDVEEAYKLMLAAREEDAPEPEEPEDAQVEDAEEHGGDDGDDGPEGPGEDGGDSQSQRKGSAKKGQKRKRGEGNEPEEPSDLPIFASRLTVLSTMVGRSFAKEGAPDMNKEKLLESVNSNLSEAEAPFTEEEFTAGLLELEKQNKVMVPDDGDGTVFLVE
jgi:DNA replication licensing factor MCM3